MRPRRLTLPQPWITHSCFAVFAVCARFLLSLYIRFTIILAARIRKDYTVGRYVFIAILCREHCLRGLYPVTLRFRALRAASEQDLCLLAIVNGFILAAMPQLIVKALYLQAMRRYRAARINCPCYYLNSSNSRSILNRIILLMFLQNAEVFATSSHERQKQDDSAPEPAFFSENLPFKTRVDLYRSSTNANSPKEAKIGQANMFSCRTAITASP